MKIIEKELNIIKQILLKSFTDPIPDGELSDFIINGSKFIRSKLVILCLKAQGYELTPNLLTVLSIGELIHNASLLHDDVIDNANSRRGKSTIANKFSKNISILSGDYLLLVATEKLKSLEKDCLFDIFSECINLMIKAEIHQYFCRKSLPSKEDYLQICIGKTASLFKAIMEASLSELGISSQKDIKFAENFGIVYQIKNDLEQSSAELDRKNGIFTAKDIFGIEKTISLLDNYNKEMSELISDFPENIYKKDLEVLIDSLCLIEKN